MKCHCCENKYSKISKKTYLCDKCGHLYQDWAKDEAWVANYYKTYRNTHPLPPKKQRELWCGNLSKWFSNKTKLSNEKVLEIGAYDARLTKKIIDIFPDIDPHVNDLDPRSLKYLSGFDNVHICNFLDLEGHFDVLIAIDVFEHIDDVRIFYDKVLALGFKHLLIQVPVNRGRKSDNVEFRPHYHNPTKKSMETFFSKDFDIVDSKITSRGETCYGPALMLSLKKKTK